MLNDRQCVVSEALSDKRPLENEAGDECTLCCTKSCSSTENGVAEKARIYAFFTKL